MGGIPVTGVSELMLEVVDLDAAERFYAQVLGLPGLHVHYAPHIDDDAFEAAVERLRSYGYEPEVLETSGRAAYVRDPDGNAVELWTWDVAGHLR